MMNSNTLIIVSNYNEDICWATSWDNALEWLLKNWLDEDVTLYTADKDVTLRERFGDNWADEVRFMTMEHFNEVFNYMFYAREEQLV